MMKFLRPTIHSVSFSFFLNIRQKRKQNGKRKKQIKTCILPLVVCRCIQISNKVLQKYMCMIVQCKIFCSFVRCVDVIFAFFSTQICRCFFSIRNSDMNDESDLLPSCSRDTKKYFRFQIDGTSSLFNQTLERNGK